MDIKTNTTQGMLPVAIGPSRSGPDVSSYQFRKVKCRVLGFEVKEYIIPLYLIKRDIRNGQARANDCPEGAVAELQNSISTEGLAEGICVEWDSNEQMFIVAWGNTRFRAVQRANTIGDTIPNLNKGEIWASIWTGSKDEKLIMQTKENVMHKPANTIDKKEVADNICELIRRGYFDGIKPFEELSMEEARTVVKDLVTKQFVAYSGKKFQGVWLIVKSSSKTLRAKMRTWDKHELSTYFRNNNDYGIPKGQPDDKDYIIEPGTLFNTELGRVAVYFATRSTEFETSLAANTARKKLVNKVADHVVVISSLNDKKENGLVGARDSVRRRTQEWNDAMTTPSFDRILFVPQSQSELDKEFIAGDFVMDYKF